MKVPLSWLRDFVKITLTPEEIQYRLTFAGLEVEDLEYVGLAPKDGTINGLPTSGSGSKVKGLAWDREKIVVAQILEVRPHPNADRLTLLRLDDGSGTERTVLTGAPNLFQYKGAGPLPKPIKAAYAREGSILYDGHQPGQQLTTLKKAKIRGVDSDSMVCSEKELGISEEHEGIIILDDDAPVGTPLADYMGDVIFTVKINPNMARNANVLGVAREIAALTGQKLKPPSYEVKAQGPSIKGQAAVEIKNPELNPRFTLMLIKGVTIGPSPYEVQRRLRLAGMRPINNIVDATNCVMLEIGEPLHAFDYDVLVKRATEDGGRTTKDERRKTKDGSVTIVTRLPEPGEKLKTLDGVERELDDYTILVCDKQGALSLGGVMGGAESEVNEKTVNVLLEAASWEFINIRKTVQSQKLPSEASYRFSRGVHPAMTVRGVSRGIELMRQWAGGVVAKSRVDEYPRKAKTVVVDLTPADVERVLGMKLTVKAIVKILESLEFKCEVQSPKREWERLNEELPNLDWVLKLTNRPDAKVHTMNLSVEEWRVVSFINAKNSIKAIAKANKMNDRDIRRIVYGLLQARMVEVIQPKGAPRVKISPPPSAASDQIRITVPDHRLDIGTGVIGQADLIEEIARIYGYERIPETQMSDTIPPQRGNASLELEERARDLLVDAGLQEIVTYSLTSPEKEQRLLPPGTPPDDRPYVTLANPVVVDRVTMRHSLLSGVLDVLTSNIHTRDRLALFEIGSVYLPHASETLPEEPRRLTIALTGPRDPLAWEGSDRTPMDFFDLKGVVEALTGGLHLGEVAYEPATHPSLMPGHTARLCLSGQPAGWLGELHPLVREKFDLPTQAVLIADLDLELLLAKVNELHLVKAVPEFPPVKEDLAVIVDESVPAARVQSVIEAAGGDLLTGVTLFDLFRGEQIGVGKKSLAYSLTYQAPNRTLTDAEVAKVRAQIVKQLEEELGASLRG